MANIRHQRREALLFREVSAIIVEKVVNAQISYPTVTGVKLTPDDRILTVYVTFQSHPQRSMAALQQTKGYVRSQLARIKSLRQVPELIFKIDPGIVRGDKIEAIIRKLHEKE